MHAGMLARTVQPLASALYSVSMISVLLPLPDTPVTQVKVPSGMLAVTFCRLFSLGALDRQPAAALGGRLAPDLGHRDLAEAREILAGEAGAVAHHVLGRALGDDVAAVRAGARAHVDQMVGGADRVLVVLDHQHRVAEVAQAGQRLQQAVVVALVQADRRLVQHIEHAGQARADLGGQPDALAFATRQRARGAVQREVGEADVVEEAQPLVDLLQDAGGDLALLGRQLGRPARRTTSRPR